MGGRWALLQSLAAVSGTWLKCRAIAPGSPFRTLPKQGLTGLLFPTGHLDRRLQGGDGELFDPLF